MPRPMQPLTAAQATAPSGSKSGETAADLIRWVAQTVHNAHHHDHAGGWWDCPKNTCRAAADALPEHAAHLAGIRPGGLAPIPPARELVERLVSIHLPRYAGQAYRATLGDVGVRLDESLELLQLWIDIDRKGCHWSMLNPAERNEVLDAIDSGE